MHGDMNSSGTSQSSIAKRTRGLRRGREADELFQTHVPHGYKREMVPGYVPVDEVCYLQFVLTISLCFREMVWNTSLLRAMKLKN
jgi:hypothetical protein